MHEPRPFTGILWNIIIEWK